MNTYMYMEPYSPNWLLRSDFPHSHRLSMGNSSLCSRDHGPWYNQGKGTTYGILISLNPIHLSHDTNPPIASHGTPASSGYKPGLSPGIYTYLAQLAAIYWQSVIGTEWEWSTGSTVGSPLGIDTYKPVALTLDMKYRNLVDRTLPG